jgi:hypothetical protein
VSIEPGRHRPAGKAAAGRQSRRRQVDIEVDMTLAPLMDFATRRRIHGLFDTIFELLSGPGAVALVVVAIVALFLYHTITTAAAFRASRHDDESIP